KEARMLFDLNLKIGLFKFVGLVGPDVIVVSSGAADADEAPNAMNAVTKTAQTTKRARAEIEPLI
ncbi:MAG: hypothetical protein ACRDKE_05470, partial [Solirubrobacterales bacterium]